MKKKAILLILVSLCSFTQEIDYSWKADLETMLKEFLSCGPDSQKPYACNVFVARALRRVYGINDFINGQNEPYRSNEISWYIKDHPQQWTLLGIADRQKTLTEAQGLANQKRAVVAVLADYQSGNGHVTLVLPGNLQPSGSWGLQVPNSASFFIGHPERAYVSDKLSKAFSADKKSQIVLYGRNY